MWKKLWDRRNAPDAAAVINTTDSDMKWLHTSIETGRTPLGIEIIKNKQRVCEVKGRKEIQISMSNDKVSNNMLIIWIQILKYQF